MINYLVFNFYFRKNVAQVNTYLKVYVTFIFYILFIRKESINKNKLVKFIFNL